MQSNYFIHTVELRWLEHLWDHRILFETWVVRATDVKLWCQEEANGDNLFLFFSLDFLHNNCMLSVLIRIVAMMRF